MTDPSTPAGIAASITTDEDAWQHIVALMRAVRRDDQGALQLAGLRATEFGWPIIAGAMAQHIVNLWGELTGGPPEPVLRAITTALNQPGRQP